MDSTSTLAGGDAVAADRTGPQSEEETDMCEHGRGKVVLGRSSKNHVIIDLDGN